MFIEKYKLMISFNSTRFYLVGNTGYKLTHFIVIATNIGRNGVLYRPTLY